MKIVTFAAIKGGVGKTTLAFNFGEWLASKGKSVLFIDVDHQCNLTQTYNIYDTVDTVANIFRNRGKVEIRDIKENISLIAGYMKLDDIESELENKSNKNMILYMWLEDNYHHLGLDKYEYILLDCHPDFATCTRNAIAISHTILSPLIPSEHGYNAKFNMEDRLDAFKKEAVNYQTRESYITAKLLFLVNRIKHNTKSSRELLKALEGNSSVVEIIPEKELFNRSTLDKKSLSDMKKDEVTYKEHKDFFTSIDGKFENIANSI